MQYVRNVLQVRPEPHPAAAGRRDRPDSPARKIQEMRYALALERELTKDEILEPLPQHRLLRRRGVRHRGGQPALLLQVRRRADPGRGRAARRAAAVAGHRQPDQRRRRRRAGPRGRTCWSAMVRLGRSRRRTRPRPAAPCALQPRQRAERLHGQYPTSATTGASSATTSAAGGTASPQFGATPDERAAPAPGRLPDRQLAGPGGAGGAAGPGR